MSVVIETGSFAVPASSLWGLVSDFGGLDKIMDGIGFSLTIKDPTSTDSNSWDKKAGWRPSASVGGSPGEDDSG